MHTHTKIRVIKKKGFITQYQERSQKILLGGAEL